MEEKNTVDCDIVEMDIDDLVDALSDNIKKDIKDFTDLVNLQGSLNREIYLGDIGGGTGMCVAGQIQFWNAVDDKKQVPPEEREPIKLYINSFGGDLTETFIMIDAIKMSKTPVWTIAEGPAYSGGFFTFITGHKRIAYPHASFLFHEGATSNGGTASQFENYAKFYRVQLNQLKDIVMNHTKLDEDWYKENQKDDVWFTAGEGICYGFVDEIAKELL